MPEPIHESPSEKEEPEPVSFDEPGRLFDFDEEDLNDRQEIHRPEVLGTLYAILGNPTATASIKEIRAVTDESYTTVRDRLETLKDRDPAFVNKLPVPEDEQENDMPDNFYAVTEHAANLLKDIGRYDEIETIRAAYHAWNPPEEIEEIEAFEARPKITEE